MPIPLNQGLDEFNHALSNGVKEIKECGETLNCLIRCLVVREECSACGEEYDAADISFEKFKDARIRCRNHRASNHCAEEGGHL